MAAPACVSTVTAVEYIQSHDIKPMILRGAQMAPFIRLAKGAFTGMENARFVAVVFMPDGAAVFFGNVSEVCGPLVLTQPVVNKLLKPA
ncbi:MAG: hypothetical protein ACXWLZ_00910 [Rhizomicrobium sp.]